MVEVTISARIPEDLETELRKFVESEEVDRSIAVRKLLSSGLKKWKEETALRMLGEGKVTFSKAAKIAGMGVWDFAEKVKESQLVWVKAKPEELAKELKQL
ncbi:UPF0175 family protein [Candidatus Woesearchaeota archaeon]|nr:UPF0175 family protein [Candidatus Woesearchaeota archaeon]